MRGYLNNLGGILVVALMIAAPWRAAQAADVTAVRVWAGPAYTRMVFDVAGVPDYRISRQGDQVVLDMARSQLAGGFSDPATQGLYRGLSHTLSGDHLQLTAKVVPGSQLKSFVLKPDSGSHYRLVLDLYPARDGAARDGSVATADAAAAGRAAPLSPSVSPVATPVATVTRVGKSSTHSSRVATMQAAALLGGERQVVVCIDAGHGGKDSGARGPDGTLEKNVTLAVARDLAAIINRQPGMKAVLTRNDDYFIPLTQRYRIARENNADLFVSIHADSYTSDDARGSSVWVLSPRGKTSEAARWLADRENRSDLIGGVPLGNMDDGLAKVLLDMQQGWAVQASDVVAGNVLKALAQLGPTHRGYVEHANFVVLRSPDVPSILVETAFISNPSEERKLRDPAHQAQLAEAVMSGVKNYFESTPPQGTWFAAQAARRNGVQLASAVPAKKSAASRTGSDTLADDASPRADADVRDLHRVSDGESLRGIARQYGISIGALKSANHIDANSVRAGTVLTIPAG